MGELPRAARRYIVTVLAAAAAWGILSIVTAPPRFATAPVALLLVVAAIVAQQFKVRSPKHQSYETTIIFFFAAVLLLRPGYVVLVIAAAHLAEMIRLRKPWYIQAFNIANFTLCALTARLLFAVSASGDAAIEPGVVLRALVAGAVFVLLNHLLTAFAIRWARSVPISRSGTFDLENVGTDLALMALGALGALLWTADPWLVPLCLAPLYLVYRSLHIPGLQAEARTDPKTGLANMKHFSEACAIEIDRAARFRRPLSILMADLDHLREINNTRGHLVGDQVIRRVAEAIRRAVREYDLAARFGGDEFAVLMPESTLPDAVLVAERIRREVESLSDTATAGQPIPITVSVGVAQYPRDGKTATDLLQAADRAVYQAKAFGRNRVFVFEDRLDAAPELVVVPMGLKEELSPVRN